MFFLLFFCFLIHLLFSSKIINEYFPQELQITSKIVNTGKRSHSLIENGYFITVWTDHTKDGQESGVKGQFFDNTGAKYGDELVLSSSTSFIQDLPSVCLLSDLTFMVIWESVGQDGSGRGIYGTLFEKIGKKVDEFKINHITTGDQAFPCIECSNGIFFVTWSGENESGSGIYGQIFDKYGNKHFEEEFLINSNKETINLHPSLSGFMHFSIFKRMLNFIVTWESYLNYESKNNSIYFKYVSYDIENRNLSSSKDYLLYFDEKDDFSFPDAAFILFNDSFLMINSTLIGKIVIVYRTKVQTGENIFSDTRFQIFDIWIDLNLSTFFLSKLTEMRASTFIFSNHSYPSVSLSKNYGFIITWQSYSQDGDMNGIYGQLFNEFGDKNGSEFQLNLNWAGDQKNPKVVMNDQGTIVVLWISRNFNKSGISLNFQMYYYQRTEIKFRNFKGEISISELPPNTIPQSIGVKILELEYSFITVWVTDVIYCEIFNTREFVKEKFFKIEVENASDVSIESLSAGEHFIIVWKNNLNNNIYCQIFSNKGISTGDYFIVNSIVEQNNTSTTRNSPKAKKLQKNSFFIIWIEENSGNFTVLGKYFFNKTHSKAEVLLNHGNYDSIYNVSIDGGYKNLEILVVWVVLFKESQNSSLMGCWWLISESQLFSKTDDFYIYNSSNSLATYPSISVNPDWPFASIIVWSGFKEGKVGENVLGQIIDSFGNQIGFCFQVNEYDFLDQKFPSVTMTPTFIFITWISFLQDSNGFGVYAAVFDLLGNKLISDFQINTEILGDQILQTLSSASLGDVVVVWFSTYSNSIKAQKIVPDYQADLSKEKILGFLSLSNFDKKNSICSVLSDDGNYSLIAIQDGTIEIVNLNFLYVINEIKISEYEILFMEKSEDFIFIGISNPFDNLILLNVADWINPYIEAKNWNISLGNNTNLMIFLQEGETNFLYVGYYYSVCILNITTPQSASILRIWEPYGNFAFADNYIFGISLDKEIMIIVDSYNIITTLEINNYLEIKNISYFHNSVFTYNTLLRNERDYLYVATKSGFEIYLNNNFEYVLLGLVSLSRYIGILKFSKDKQYLSCTSPTGHYLFTLENPKNPQLLNFLLTVNKISSTTITGDNQLILMAAQSGTTIQKAVNKNNESTPYMVFSGFQNIPNPANFIQLSPNHDIIYGMTKDLEFVVLSFKIDNITDSSALNIAEESATESSFLLFAFLPKTLKIFQIVNNTKFNLKGSLDIIYDDYIVSSKKDLIYFVSLEDIIFLKIVNVSVATNPKIISTFNMTNFTTYPNITFANSEENELILTMESYGIVKINVSDPFNPSLILVLFSNNYNLNLIAKLKENIFLVTNYERIFAMEISQNTTILTETLTFGSKIYAIQTLDESYAFVLTSNNITLIDIHNITNPIILDYKSLKIPLTSSPKMVVSSKNKCIYIRFIQVFCLFGSFVNYLYSDISINPKNDKIELIITFWPVNLISGNSIKLIKITNINSAFSWISIDYENFKITVYPSSYFDLQSILQPLELVYVTKIQTQELNSDEMFYLKMSGYIDEKLFITEKYNNSKSLYIDHPSVSAEKIKFILGSHYNLRKYYFNTNEFLKLIPASEIVNPIQTQLNKIAVGGQITIDSEFSFYISTTTTKNHYNTDLSYSAINLPKWMEFDNKNLRFSGTPSINDTGDYNITVSIFNGFHNTNDNLILKVRYFPPKVNENMRLQKQIGYDPEVELESQIFISKNTFIDPNNDTLTYAATLNGQILPNWMQFDSTNLLLRITPTAETFQKSYTIVIGAKNKHFEVSDSLTFVVQTSWIYTLKLIAQILGPLITVLGLIKYRNLIYNFFFPKYYLFPEENLYVDAYFEKEIYFIKDDLKTGSLFFFYLKKNKKLKALRDIEIGSENFQKTLRDLLQSIHDEVPSLINVELPLLEKEGTIFVITEAFLAHYLARKKINKSTYEIYLKMKKMLKKQNGNYWYHELVNFEYYLTRNRDLKFEKFPPIKINTENVESFLKMSLKKDKLIRGSDIIKISLIYSLLKADSLGIPKKPKKWYNFVEPTRGESCFANVYEIEELRAQRRDSNKNFLKEAVGNEKLPYWLKFKIKYGILTLYGTPPIHEYGVFKVVIVDHSGFIIRAHIFKIIPSLQKLKNANPIQKINTQILSMNSKEYTFISKEKEPTYLSRGFSKLNNFQNVLEIKENFSEENSKKNSINNFEENAEINQVF